MKCRAGRDFAYDPNYNTRITPPFNYGVRIVPERIAYVIERFGKYDRTLESGIHLLIPLVHLCLGRFAYWEWSSG